MNMREAIMAIADERPQRGCWAPGDYICKCTECGCFFSGDKRAVICAPCAYGDKK